jgi:uncharacterized damage-inducible protein DinB
MDTDPKATLHRYLRSGREALLWKLDGLTDYDARRPLTPTGTNVLGVVKHVASMEIGYFGEVFDRPAPIELPWLAEDAEPNADMWAEPEESRADILQLHHAAAAHADATIEALALDATGRVPWWSAGQPEVTLHQILVHMIAETHRHAGHVDIVRELIDGAAGLRLGNENLPAGDAGWWGEHHDRVQRAARHFADEPAR